MSIASMTPDPAPLIYGDNFSDVPRLAYLSEVAVENTSAGSQLMFRLLRNYPADKLQIWQASQRHASLGLAGADYFQFYPPFKRFERTRFAAWRHRMIRFIAPLLASRLWRRAKQFRPEAVLTISHNDYWKVADEFAQIAKLPLHLICHDDFFMTGAWPSEKDTAAHPLRHTYQRAASRLCISRQMEKAYHSWFGVRGTVLLPCREALEADPSPAVVSIPHTRRPFTCAYAGSLHAFGYQQALHRLGEALMPVGGKVLVYGPSPADQAQMPLLQSANIRFCGHVRAVELALRIRAEADCLFLPMSFERDLETNMRLSFPSKLADYTAIGLPILVNAPSECSAVQWANEFPGAAMVVAEESVEALIGAVRLLASDAGLRVQLGKTALKVGADCFSLKTACNILFSALQTGQNAQLRGDSNLP